MRVRILLALLGASMISDAGASREVHIQLLAINDFHGNIEPPGGSDGAVNGVAAGGAEYLATHLKTAAAGNPNTLLVGAGDLMGASPLLSSLFKDAPTVEALNAMHLAVTALGNHELDPGPKEFLRRSKPAHYLYLASNMVHSSDGRRLLPATYVRRIGGVKIGFIGELLENAPSSIAASSTKGLQFLPEAKLANEAAARLERQGVHAIVLLTHQGGSQQRAGGNNAPLDPNGCQNMRGPILDVVRDLSPAIKVVVSGHSHEIYNCEINGHLLTSAGSYGRLYTSIDLTIDRAKDTVLKAVAKNTVVTRDVAKDETQTAILAKYKSQADALIRKPVGRITAAIARTANRAGEVQLGDVITDAHIASLGSPDKGGAQVAFINGSGIRAALDSGPGGREVTYGDLYSVEPFGNRMMVFTMTGDAIRRLLEQQFGEGGRASILQVSEGFSYQYRREAPAGQHVVAGSITLGGRPVGPEDKVRVATTDFLYTGGSGFTVFGESKDAVMGPLALDDIVAYFESHSPVEPGKQNRIVRVD